ncbi:hypothetical protein CPC16_005772, partial [Podila verticillata]
HQSSVHCGVYSTVPPCDCGGVQERVVAWADEKDTDIVAEDDGPPMDAETPQAKRDLL